LLGLWWKENESALSARVGVVGHGEKGEVMSVLITGTDHLMTAQIKKQ
jgi:hypothetical protein